MLGTNAIDYSKASKDKGFGVSCAANSIIITAQARIIYIMEAAAHPLVNVAVKAARAAGNFIVRSLDHRHELVIEEKQRNDFVTSVDRNCEKLIIQTIKEAYPRHAFLGEESGASQQDLDSAEVVWIIDPLDGTSNFLHGNPVFAVSIAAKVRGELAHAVVYDPMRQELFTASKGRGAQLDNRRIRISQVRKLEEAMIGTGIPSRKHQNEYVDQYFEILKQISKKSAGVRRPGAAALDLAWVAAGRLDGFFEFGLGPWDIAAGALLIQEAGGIVTSAAGGDKFVEKGHIIAGNERVHSELIKNIRPLLPVTIS